MSAASLPAQTIDVLFHWSQPSLQDERGNALAAAVEYEVYHQIEGGIERLLTTVSDTTYVLAVEPGLRHRLRVRGLDHLQRPGLYSEWSDEIFFEAPQSEGVVPLATTLRQNYPNPFNPETTIVYGVPESFDKNDPVRLEIYDVRGHRIRNLEPVREPGWHSILWDGTDDSGQVMPTGQYLTMLSCGNEVQTAKMTMIK